MRTSVQKPVLALMSAACIAAPAVVGAPHAAVAASSAINHSAVALTAEATLFDPVPAAARLVDVNVDGIGSLATADVGTLVDLLTFPYHNVYAVGSAVGRAANAGIQALGLPLSLAYFLATNAGDATIQDYLNGVQTNVDNAIPGIIKAIQDEIAYDLALFNAVFGGSATADSPVQATALAAPTAGITASAADIGRLVDLLTFPYHNVYTVGSAVGRAANAGIQVLGLPLSLGFFLLTNASDTTVQTYLNGVQTNVDNAIPGIVKAIQDEIAYNQALFSDFFGGSSAADAMTVEALAAPTEGVAVAAPTDRVKASAAGIDIDTLVDLATLPYHNVYGVGSAFGKAANAGIQVAGLPLSLGYYLLTNASDTTIQNYLDGVQNNVNNAIPGIVKAIQDEISYDQQLFAKVFGGATTSTGNSQKALDAADATTGATVDSAGVEKAAGEDTGKTTVDGKQSQETTTGTATDPDAVAPHTKSDVRHAFDMAAAVKALGDSFSGIGKHASGKSNDASKDDIKQDDEKQGDAKQDDAKQDDAKQDDTKKDDTKKSDTAKDDAGRGAAKADDGDSGQPGGRHRLAG